MSKRHPVIAKLTDFADVIVYGATPAGIVAALSAARQGSSVVLLGGWRERHVGGMMSGGLGWTDARRPSAFGGFSKSILVKLAGKGMPGNPLAFDPVKAEPLFSSLLKDAGVPVVWTTGIEEVVKRDRQIQSIRTADGFMASGRIFIDASYEGDLLARAGVSYRVGRGAANAANPHDGYRGPPTGEKAWNAFGIAGHKLEVSPFADTSGSLLPGISPTPRETVGAPDQAVQAYCFRLTMTTDPARRVDLPATPPDGYRSEDYEILLRSLEAAQQLGLQHGRDWSFSKDLLHIEEVAPGIFDINDRGPLSIDAIGKSWAYPEASYRDRETIWKAHETHIRGFFYTLGHSNDPRIPASLRREVLGWGLVKGRYNQPHPNDQPGWPYQLYIREARRLSNGLDWSGADLGMPDRTAPRSGRIVGMASYMLDSHPVQRIASRNDAGRWTVINEGSFLEYTAGRDQRSPLPFDIILPHRDEATNLLVPFCVASTHEAFSAIRMEPSAMALGEAAGTAAAIAVSMRDVPAVQDVPYMQLEAALRANGAVLDEETLTSVVETDLRRWVRQVM